MQFAMDDKTLAAIKENGGVFAIKALMCSS